MSNDYSSTEGVWSQHHTAEARSLYIRAQKEGEAVGRSHLLPASLLLALLTTTPLLDPVLQRANVSRPNLVAEVTATLKDDQVVVEEGAYVKHIAPHAVKLAAARGSDEAEQMDVLLALLRSDPPSLTRVFASYGLSLEEVEHLARASAAN